MTQGKAYANRKPIRDRPIGDFYCTPRSLVWLIEDFLKKEFSKYVILDPCAGLGCISDELKHSGLSVITNDLYHQDNDFQFDYLTDVPNIKYSRVVMNPPFSLWDAFVERAKGNARKVLTIGRLNYLSTVSRQRSGIFDNLKYIFIFSRYVDYRTPDRGDGLFHVGAMATGWFYYDGAYTGLPKIKFLDVQDYAKLGIYKETQQQ